MNKNIIIGIVVLVVIIFAGWTMSSPASLTQTDTAETSTTKTTTTSAKPKGTSTTFKSIFTQDANTVCEYEQVGVGTVSANAIYIADGKMRAEFRTTDTTGTTATLMIYTGGYLYTWSEGATVAKRTSIQTIADLPKVIPRDLTSGAIFGSNIENVSWDCHGWNKDAKLLVVPTYLKY